MSDDYDPPACRVCGGEAEWVECQSCHGDGEIDCYDDDHVNLSPGEEVDECPDCGGDGGWLECQRLPHTDAQMTEYRRVKP